MVEATKSSTDKGAGMTLGLATLAALGAVAMVAGAPDVTAAWGFAAAVLFAALATVAVHVYWA